MIWSQFLRTGLQALALLLAFGINPHLFIKTIWTVLAIGAIISVVWLIIIESNYDGEFIHHLLRTLMMFFEGLKPLRNTDKANLSSGKCLHRYYIRGVNENKSKIGNKRANVHLESPYQAHMENDDGDQRSQLVAACLNYDSFVIRVDNHASKCMSNRKHHFFGPI